MMSEKLEINSVVEGKVVKIKPFGAIVTLPDRSQGLVHISHISNRYVQDINDFLAVGDLVNVKILSVDEANGKTSLSIKEAEPKPEQEEPVQPVVSFAKAATMPLTFEEKFKDWVKSSNERQAGLNKRNKRR